MELIYHFSPSLIQIIGFWIVVLFVLLFVSFFSKKVLRLTIGLVIIFALAGMCAGFVHMTGKIPFELQKLTGMIFVVAAFISLLYIASPFSKFIDKLCVIVTAVGIILFLGYEATQVAGIVGIAKHFILYSFMAGLLIPPVVGYITRQPIIAIIIINIISYLMSYSKTHSPGFTITSKSSLEVILGVMLSWVLGVIEGFFFLSPEDKRRYYFFVLIDGLLFYIAMYMMLSRLR